MDRNNTPLQLSYLDSKHFHLRSRSNCTIANFWRIKRKFRLCVCTLTLQDPPPRFSFHQRVFSKCSFPSSCSFRIAPLMAVLYGESKVTKSFFEQRPFPVSFYCARETLRKLSSCPSFLLHDFLLARIRARPVGLRDFRWSHSVTMSFDKMFGHQMEG